MNCQEARELFELWVDKALDEATARKFDDHLHGCSSCRAACNAVETESDLLSQALGADLTSSSEIARIEALVRERTRPASSAFDTLGDWIVPVLGTLLGVLILVWGRFDGARVREAICLSVSPPGGLPVAISSVLVTAVAVLAVIVIQPFMFRRREQD